jgi:dTDP-4-dehydrorhamnose reductase
MTTPISVLVLGASGMLGSTVVRRLRASHADWRVDGTARAAGAQVALDAEAGRPGIGDLFRLGRYDYVINCIGVLKSDIDDGESESVERAIRVNALFPHEVADVAAERRTHVIHISTDAVFSGRRHQPYTEADVPDPTDTYGRSKALGESPASNVLNIRLSIVGRDSRQRGLVDWYLAVRSESVIGFMDYVWTPVTTVQVADVCAALVCGGFDDVRGEGHILHFAPNPPLSKADFLERLREVTGSGPAVQRRPGPDGPCSRVLVSDRQPLPEISQSREDWSVLIPELLAEFASRGA